MGWGRFRTSVGIARIWSPCASCGLSIRSITCKRYRPGKCSLQIFLRFAKAVRDFGVWPATYSLSSINAWLLSLIVSALRVSLLLRAIPCLGITAAFDFMPHLLAAAPTTVPAGILLPSCLIHFFAIVRQPRRTGEHGSRTRVRRKQTNATVGQNKLANLIRVCHAAGFQKIETPVPLAI